MLYQSSRSRTGRFDEAEELTQRTAAAGRQVQQWDAEASRVFALYALPREHGRLAKIQEDLRQARLSHPGYRSFGCMLLMTMRPDEARTLFDQFAADEFAGFPKRQRVALRAHAKWCAKGSSGRIRRPLGPR